MLLQRRRDTKPELLVRRQLHDLGISFRLSNRDLPGSPDIANRRRRWAIFVHGCFWHQHPACRGATFPKRNRGFWREKFAQNARRDQKKIAALEAAGFTVLVVWECETRNVRALRGRLRKEMSRFRPRGPRARPTPK